MRKASFTKFLDSMNEEELKEELDKLYSGYKPIKEYYTMELGTVEDRKKLLDRAKTGVERLYERRKTRSRLSKVNTILKDITLISIFDHELVEVYLHHVESASNHISRFGLRNDADANHLITSFKKSVDLILTSQTQDEYLSTLIKAITKLEKYSILCDEMNDYISDLLH